MKRPQYDVYLDDAPEPITVTITHADQLVGEAAAARNGIPVDPGEAPQAHSTLYVWAALQRMGLKPGKWQEFSTTRLVGFQRARDDDGAEVAAEVDPTPPGPRTEPR